MIHKHLRQVWPAQIALSSLLIRVYVKGPMFWLTIPTQPKSVGLGRTNFRDSLNEQIIPVKSLSLTQSMIGTVRLNIPNNLATLHYHVGIGTHSSSSCVPANIVSHS
jgi:hypothetical protein